MPGEQLRSKIGCSDPIGDSDALCQCAAPKVKDSSHVKEQKVVGHAS